MRGRWDRGRWATRGRDDPRARDARPRRVLHVLSGCGIIATCPRLDDPVAGWAAARGDRENDLPLPGRVRLHRRRLAVLPTDLSVTPGAERPAGTLLSSLSGCRSSRLRPGSAAPG